MEFPKQIKDTVYRLLQEPTLDHFREFLQDQTGEHNAIDFKQEWIEKDKLAKLMLALAVELSFLVYMKTVIRHFHVMG